MHQDSYKKGFPEPSSDEWQKLFNVAKIGYHCETQGNRSWKERERERRKNEKEEKERNAKKVSLIHFATVTYGYRGSKMAVVKDSDQLIDQVFCAAINIGQGYSGMLNSRDPEIEKKVSSLSLSLSLSLSQFFFYSLLPPSLSFLYLLSLLLSFSLLCYSILFLSSFSPLLPFLSVVSFWNVLMPVPI
jgi:hypothetical protein